VVAVIGAELQEVLDLAPEYTRITSPAMRARDEACTRLKSELEQALAIVSAVGPRPALKVAVGGRQASYSPLAWVRIYSPEHSPSATAGMYLAYLFAADGARVYLSLQQGSSEIRAGEMRPVNDPAELLARGAAARSAICDLAESSLGAGMAVRIDLGWRLASVGSYSKQRIRNHEYANILAIVYDSGNIPADDTLVADLHRGVVLLTALYGDVVLLEDASLLLSTGSIQNSAGRGAAKAQGYLKEAAIRRALELHAEDSAEDYFRRIGWRNFRRVGHQHLGYDLECENTYGKRFHVEVKGTQGLGEEVFLTRNEAAHSGPRSQCGAAHALYVLSGIEVTGTGAIKCTGGIPHCVQPWVVQQAALTPTVYAYRVPRR
jgi:hypothetical protein